MKIRYLKLRNVLLGMMAAALGLNIGCQKRGGDGGGEIVPLYACPIDVYHVSGRVHNSQGEGIPGIEVAGEMGERDTTDAAGRYVVESSTLEGEPFAMTVRDIDGDANGRYRDTTVTIPAGGGMIEDCDIELRDAD